MRDKQPVLAVLAVVAVVIGFVWAANVMTRPASSTDVAGPTTSTVSQPGDTSVPSATPTPTATPSVLAGCTPLPPAQTTAKRITTAPDIEGARGRMFVATITTNCGPITVELDGAKAPATVSAFILLAQQGYWAPSACHRLTGDAQGIWVLQCGDALGKGTGPGPGFHYGIENAPADGTYPAGSLAMARGSDPSSNSDQWFITYKDTKLPTQGGGYSIFGKVTGGLDIVQKIAAAGVNPADQTSPMAPIGILTVTVQPKAA